MGDYLATYVERDIRQLLVVKDLGLFEKFVRLTAGRVGQLLNLNSLANDVGISHPTARGWMTLLEASYVVFLLPPWFGNVSKRLIKSPKLYFHDVGLASYLLGLENERQVARDPLRGNLFENLAVVEALKYRWNRGETRQPEFLSGQSGERGGPSGLHRLPTCFRWRSRPAKRSVRTLSRGWIRYPGSCRAFRSARD